MDRCFSDEVLLVQSSDVVLANQPACTRCFCYISMTMSARETWTDTDYTYAVMRRVTCGLRARFLEENVLTFDAQLSKNCKTLRGNRKSNCTATGTLGPRSRILYHAIWLAHAAVSQAWFDSNITVNISESFNPMDYRHDYYTSDYTRGYKLSLHKSNMFQL